MTTEYKGGCLCGGITFSVKGFSKQAANCYCTMCRKFHGAAFGTLVGVKGLKWLSGEALCVDYIADNGAIRTFCNTCGSSLGFRIAGTPIQEIELAVATFDVDIPVKIDAQIYTAYKANWCELQSDLLTFSDERE